MRVGATSGSTSLLSDRIQAGADAATNASFKAIELTSSNSPLTVFETAEPLLASDDGDGATDVYMRVGATSGNTSLLSDRIQARSGRLDRGELQGAGADQHGLAR